MTMAGSLDIKARLREVDYIPDDTLAVALQFALDLQRPLLLEGEAGVGKTEIARALAAILDTRLIRLQCYEGLDASNAIYEWNYQRQLLAIKAKEHEDISADTIEDQIFSEHYLLKRPLLEAISQPISPVLLIDEVDRADEEFEAYLLEILSDYQITVPELGTISAKSIPHVVLTSNGTRELSDALRRRCLYTYLEFPSPERELEIVLSRGPGVEQQFAAQIVRFIHGLREEDLEKVPGIAETLDWATALVGMNLGTLDGDLERIRTTLICLLKTQADQKSISAEVVGRLVGQAT
ncbi:MAG: AAA family ATPase [Alphaproteobacteria bacterium]